MAEDEKKQSWITKKDKKKEFAKKLLKIVAQISPLALPTMIVAKIKGLTAKKAEDKGMSWMENLMKELGQSPKSVTSVTRAAQQGKKGVPEQHQNKAKGGIVQKFSKGGTVERPRGVGIAKRGYGRVIR